MPRKISYECKVCGTEKKDSNNWFVFTPSKIGFQLMTWHTAIEHSLLNNEDVEYICGAGCSHKILDQYLTAAKEGKEA
jgi:hypothetical protein